MDLVLEQARDPLQSSSRTPLQKPPPETPSRNPFRNRLQTPPPETISKHHL
jgi:hypothetical protein